MRCSTDRTQSTIMYTCTQQTWALETGACVLGAVRVSFECTQHWMSIVCTTPPTGMGSFTNSTITYIDPSGNTPPDQGNSIPVNGVAEIQCDYGYYVIDDTRSRPVMRISYFILEHFGRNRVDSI
ncbi:unnamed protein product [Sphagnum balticum]